MRTMIRTAALVATLSVAAPASALAVTWTLVVSWVGDIDRGPTLAKTEKLP